MQSDVVEAASHLTFCPNCSQECFDAVVTESGDGYSYEFGCPSGWVSGHGKCGECGYNGEWADSWP